MGHLQGRSWATALAAGIALAGVAVSAGCRGERSEKRPREFLPDMDNSPKWKPQVKTDFFEDQRSMRPRVEGAVAFGETDRVDDTARAEYLKEDQAFYQGISGYDTKGAPVFLDEIPVAGFEGWPAQPNEGEAPTDFLARREAFMSKIIQRGQERFNIYCSVCHGFAGDGQGMVGRRWTTPVANFHDPKYMDKSGFQGKDGYIFNVIRHGVPFPNTNNEALRMPSYAHAVNEHDAWAIVSYVRALQQSRAPLADVPPAEREALRAIPKPAPLTKPAAAPAGTTPASPTPANTTPAGTTGGGGAQ